MMRSLARLRFPPLLASAACLLLPREAAAHLPTIGLGPVYDGVLHLLLSPEDLIPVIALALLSGQRGAPFGRRATWLCRSLGSPAACSACSWEAAADPR